MNLYTKTIGYGSFGLLLTIVLTVTLKPAPYNSSPDFSSGSNVSADTPKHISDEELTSFFNVNNAISSLREYLREQLQSILTEHDMTKQRYNQIAVMENDPKSISDATEHERETAKIISGRIAELQFEIQQQTQSVINEHRLTEERFLEIAEQLSKDSGLRSRFEKFARNQKHSRRIAREFRFRFC